MEFPIIYKVNISMLLNMYHWKIIYVIENFGKVWNLIMENNEYMRSINHSILLNSKYLLLHNSHSVQILGWSYSVQNDRLTSYPPGVCSLVEI